MFRTHAPLGHDALRATPACAAAAGAFLVKRKARGGHKRTATAPAAETAEPSSPAPAEAEAAGPSAGQQPAEPAGSPSGGKAGGSAAQPSPAADDGTEQPGEDGPSSAYKDRQRVDPLQEAEDEEVRACLAQAWRRRLSL